MDRLSRNGYLWSLVFIGLLLITGLICSDMSKFLEGFRTILYASDVLITDYFSIAGIGPTLVNVSAVTLITLLLMYFNKMPMHSGGVVTLGLMSGFSFFGKNIFNMWFILFGTYLYCFVKRERFSKYLTYSLLSTALGPLISTTFFSDGICAKGVLTSVACGVLIGFVMPLLAIHTEKLLHGLNLYNGGFALGLLALIIVPILKSYGFQFTPVLHWSTGKNFEIGVFLYLCCALLILGGYLEDRKNAVHNYFTILKRPGAPKDDFIELDGMGAVLINMGVNGAIGISYILLVGGSLNGPTIGGILTIVGFSAKGKHARNIIPVMLGVALGGLTKQWSPAEPSAQLAALFGTTLAPVSGAYGILAGIVAGFIHSSVVLHAGLGYSGVNLYNNGFAGGVTSIVMYSVLSSFMCPKTFLGSTKNKRKRE